MCFSNSKKKRAKRIKEHNALIEDIISKVKLLKVRYEEQEEIVEVLNDIMLKASNFSAAVEKDDRKTDKHILSILEDVEVAYNKAEKNDNYEVVLSKLKRVREFVAGK